MSILKYWHKIANSDSGKIAVKMYKLIRVLQDRKLVKSKWLQHVKKLLDNLGLSELWNNSNMYNWHEFNTICMKRIKDQYIQKWDSEVTTGEKCVTYRLFKHNIKFEKYLDNLPEGYRSSFTKFRLGNHKLPIETGRHKNIPRERRLCTLCSCNKLGDEFHVIFECRKLEKLRKKWFPSLHQKRYNVCSFDALFNTDNSARIVDIVKFIRGAGIL